MVKTLHIETDWAAALLVQAVARDRADILDLDPQPECTLAATLLRRFADDVDAVLWPEPVREPDPFLAEFGEGRVQ